MTYAPHTSVNPSTKYNKTQSTSHQVQTNTTVHKNNKNMHLSLQQTDY